MMGVFSLHESAPFPYADKSSRCTSLARNRYKCDNNVRIINSVFKYKTVNDCALKE